MIISTLAIWATIGYFLGSIPFGLVLTRVFGFGDIRKVGSGNIGATNVLRATGRKDLTLLTIALDASKAALAAYLASKVVDATVIAFGKIITEPGDSAFIMPSITTSLNIIAALAAGTFAVIGHNFPVWLKFKGGKGVASAFGLILFLTPKVALLALATWILVAIVTRYSSLSAITAATLVPLYTWIFAGPLYFVFYLPIVILVLIRHHSNFRRLFKGEESKISFKKKEKAESK